MSTNPSGEPAPSSYKSGYAAIAGKPNAGKSTFLNAVLGTKLSIISPKVQTTRHRITGIHSDERGQIVFLDTPGILEPRYKLHERMMRAVGRSLEDADIILFITDPGDIPEKDELEVLRKAGKKPLLSLINKSDRYSETTLDTARARLEEVLQPTETHIVSALHQKGVDAIAESIFNLLPQGPPFYPPDQLSEHPERFFVSELIREQLFDQYRAEIPYSCAVNVLTFSDDKDMVRIEAEIVVNRNSQKGILIGKGGAALKKLGTVSRQEIERFTGRKVFLNLFVKVREKWRDNDTFLRSYGYDS